MQDVSDLMRIAFVSDNSYPWFNGGIEKRRFIIMHRLAQQGHEVHCFTMYRREMPGREFVYEGIRYHTVAEALSWQGMYRGGGRRRSIRMPIIFSLGLMLDILPYRFDILDADSFPFLHLLPLYFYTRFRRTQFAITWHEVWSKEFWKNYLKGFGIVGYWVEWICSRMGDVHIANVSTTKKLLVNELNVSPKKILVFPVAVDSDEIKSFTSRSKPPKKKNQFIVVNRLVKHKRVALAISAIAKTKAKLIIIGVGPDLAELQEFAKREAPGQVTFRHSISTNELFKHMLESHALIMPSEREGLSLVTVEALALGVPVVIANTSSLPEELKKRCIVANENELGSMLNKLIKHGRRYAERARGMRTGVLKRFSGDSAQQIYEEAAER